MPYPGNTFYRSELDHSVLKELDEHNAVLNGFLSMEHGPDGSHTDITAESITTGLLTANVVAEYLRLNPYKLYTVKPTDGAAFVTDATDPDVSLWYANSAAAVTINGMYVNDLIRGVPGHLQIVINNSTFIHTYQSAVVTNACRLYGLSTAVPVPPGGAIFFVYDGLNLGWRYVGSSATSGTGIPANIAYTNVANVFTEDQTISKAAYATLTLTATGASGLYRAYGSGFAVPGLAGRAAIGGEPSLAVIANYGFGPSGGPGVISMRAGGYDAPAEQMSLDKTGVTITQRLRVGGAGFGLANVNLTADGQAAFAMYRPGVIAWQFGTRSTTLVFSTAGGALTDALGGDKFSLDATGVLGVSNYFASGAAFIYIGGHRVDVTADCSIPGTGGGASLPPNIAYTNVANHWGPVQYFDGGLTVSTFPVTVNGPTTLDNWFDQSVKTGASPTFAGVTATTYNSGGKTGATGLGGAVSLRTALGGTFYIEVTGGIVTYFAGIPP